MAHKRKLGSEGCSDTDVEPRFPKRSKIIGNGQDTSPKHESPSWCSPIRYQTQITAKDTPVNPHGDQAPEKDTSSDTGCPLESTESPEVFPSEHNKGTVVEDLDADVCYGMVCVTRHA
jgi:hypothetical protein